MHRMSSDFGPVEVHRFTYFLPRRLQRLAYTAAMRDAIHASHLARLQVPCYLVAQTVRTVDLVRRLHIDVLNSHWLVPQGLSGAVASQFCHGLRHVVHAHAGDVYMLSRLQMGRSVARFVLSHSDAVAASGSHVRSTLDHVLGRPSGAVLQPMGADPSVCADAQQHGGAAHSVEDPGFADGYLLFFGRLVEKKGVIYLLRAMPRILAARPGLGLVIIGSGPLDGELNQEARRLGIGASVRFIGALPQSHIARYLHACRAAVVPSVIDSHGETEGMPTVVLESMAAGTRVIGSDVDGIPDIIRHAHNGWLCRPADPDHLATTILLALDCPESGPIIGAARQTAARFDWPAVARSYMQVLARTDMTIVKKPTTDR